MEHFGYFNALRSFISAGYGGMYHLSRSPTSTPLRILTTVLSSVTFLSSGRSVARMHLPFSQAICHSQSLTLNNLSIKIQGTHSQDHLGLQKGYILLLYLYMLFYIGFFSEYFISF